MVGIETLLQKTTSATLAAAHKTIHNKYMILLEEFYTTVDDSYPYKTFLDPMTPIYSPTSTLSLNDSDSELFSLHDTMGHSD